MPAFARASDAANTSEDGQLTLDTVVAGYCEARVTVAQGVQVGSPTGGDKGAGTLNANAVYDDNTLLTDYVFNDRAPLRVLFAAHPAPCR